MELPAVGAIFDDKYEIVRRLGRGGFASVFLARDHEVQREVAIKILAPDDDGGYRAGVKARFMTEARVLAGLQDSHTIRLFTFGQSSNGLLFMVFQYVAGQDLSDLLTASGSLPEPVAVHIALQVLDALAEAHAAGVLHRDMKPANVLVYEHLGDPYAVKLLDFGIAKVDPAVGGLNLTKTGAVVGTPRYMAPEQVFGEPFGPSADVYGVGLLLFEMLVGHPAVQGDRQAIMRHHAAQQEHVVPRNVARPAVVDVLQRMLAREPIDRFATALEARSALTRAVTTTRPSEPNRAPPFGPGPGPVPANRRQSGPHPGRPGYGPTEVTEPKRKLSGWVVFVGSALFSFVVLGAYLLYSSQPPPPQSSSEPVEVRPELLETATPAVPATIDMSVGEVEAPDTGPELDLAPSKSGCGLDYDGGNHRYPVVYNRTAGALLPKDYDPSRKYPVIMTWAARYTDGDDFVRDTKLWSVSFEHDVIILQVPTDNMLDPWESPNDVAVAEDTLQGAKRRFCVDATRVFGLAHYEGVEAMRAFSCQRQMSGLAVSGSGRVEGSTWCGKEFRAPITWVTGRHDEFLPEEGGRGCRGGPFYKPAMWDEKMRVMNGCSAKTRPVPSAVEHATCKIYEDCEFPYQSCVAIGGRHLRKRDLQILYTSCGRKTLKYDVGPEAWTFFEKHGRVLTESD